MLKPKLGLMSIAFALSACDAAGTDGDPTESLTCGAGTENVDGVCVAAVGEDLACGAGTVQVGDECVAVVDETPAPLVGGRFQSPMVLTQNLHEVGSHTDEVRIREDGTLLNCSYSFNVIDASVPNDMERTHEEGLTHVIPDDTRTPGCKHLAWDGDLVFTTHLGNIRNPAFLSGWDITDPEHPVQLQVLQEPGVSYEGVDVANHHIFVGRHSDGLGVYTYDLITGFTLVGSLDGFANAWGIAARDTEVFVADGVGGLVTVDASDPAHPVELGRAVVGGQAKGVVVHGDYAYVAAGSAGVAVVDIANLADPQVVAQIDMPGTALRIAYSEGHIFVAAWNDTRVYDVSDPAAPELIAAVRIPRPYDYADPDRELPTMRTFGVAALGHDVFIGTWENPYSYRLFPERRAPSIRLPETAARVDFGAVTTGTSKTMAFPVTNEGTAPLTLVDVWAEGSAFSVTPSQARIAPGQTVDLMVTYAAGGPEEVGYLNIVSDDPSSPHRKPYLTGNQPGVSVGSPLPETVATMLDGTTWNSTDTTGSVLLLTYFATYCPVCANHLPDLQERFWQGYQGSGLEMVSLNPRESVEQIGLVQDYVDSLEVTLPAGIESPNVTYTAIVSAFEGPNPFPVDVIVDKQGIVRYATHEYDPDAMEEMIDLLLAE